jgi:hypothetical protein
MRFVWKLHGSLSYGEILKDKGRYIIQDEGKRFVSESVLRVRGKKLPPFRDVYIRLN